MRSVGAVMLLALFAWVSACKTLAPDDRQIERRKAAEDAIAKHGLQDDAAVEAGRAELEAELAREDGDAIADGFELRTAGEVQGDLGVPVLARMPIANVLALREQKKARRSSSEAALARLEEVVLERRAMLCLPSLDWLVHTERTQIYERYAARQSELVAWNAELGNAGMLDEVEVVGFELASKADLTTRLPNPPPPVVRPDLVFAVLPAVPERRESFSTRPESVREEVLRSQPAIGVHRALKARYEALSEREKISQYPSLKFVDLGFDALTHSGQKRAVLGRVSVEIPFGTNARAEARHYAALANRESSRERLAVEERIAQAQLALAELQAFHDRSARWRELLTLADSAEVVADRWFAQRLVRVGEVASLLDKVFRTRQAVLDARERAGLANCSLLAATGRTAANWPRE